MHDIVVTSAPFEERGQETKTVDDLKREVAEISPSSITTGEWDMLYAVEGQQVELFRTREDRGHLDDVFAENPEIARRIHQQYVAWLERVDTPDRFLDPRRNL